MPESEMKEAGNGDDQVQISKSRSIKQTFHLFKLALAPIGETLVSS
jgi:hypothetical protein